MRLEFSLYFLGEIVCEVLLLWDAKRSTIRK